MKTVFALVLLGASQLCVATPLPDPGLLRVPRIYNALITTDAKLQPSRASPYSIPAVPVIGPVPGEFARVDDVHTHHHASGRKAHHDGQDETRKDSTHVPAHGKEGKKMSPSSRMYPETFYPQSVGYYPHPFIPYSYPLAPHPYPFGQYSSAGVGGGSVGAGSFSALGGPGFAAGSGLGAGFGPYNPLPLGPGGEPSDFAIEQSSSLHMTSGRRHGVVDTVDTEDTENAEDGVDSGDAEDTNGEGDEVNGEEVGDEEEV